MPEYEITDHGNGSYTVRDTTFDEVSGLGGVSAVALYVAGLIGMIIMLTNVVDSAPAMLVFAIIALVIYVLVPICGLFMGGIGRVLCLLAKYGVFMFDFVLIAFYFLAFNCSASNMSLYALMFLSMFGIYYFPFFGIYYGGEYDCPTLKKCTIIGIVVGVIAFVVLGLNTETLLPVMSEKLGEGITEALGSCMQIVLPTSMAIFVTFGAFVLLIRDKKDNPNVAAAIILTVVILGGCVGGTYGIYASNVKRYEDALALTESGDYYEARQNLYRLDRFRDSADRFNQIALKDLRLGEVIRFGLAGSGLYAEGIDWVVIKVEGDRALLYSVQVLTWGYDVERANQRMKYVFSDFDEQDLAKLSGQTDYILSREEWEQLVPEQYKYNYQRTDDFKESLEDELEWHYYNNYIKGTLLQGADGDVFVNLKTKAVEPFTEDITGVRPAIWINMD